MCRLAIDVVLLPDEEMTNKAIEANRQLVAKYGRKIVLNKEYCLPHISLAMGCIDEKDIGTIEQILKTIARENPIGQLQVIGISISTNSLGETVSVFGLEKTRKIQSLHEQVMTNIRPYLSFDVTADMVNADEVSQSCLLWIKNYERYASYAKFLPHITIGYGQVDKAELPIKFRASKLALCHLGNHCTCSKVLAVVDL